MKNTFLNSNATFVLIAPYEWRKLLNKTLKNINKILKKNKTAVPLKTYSKFHIKKNPRKCLFLTIYSQQLKKIIIVWFCSKERSSENGNGNCSSSLFHERQVIIKEVKKDNLYFSKSNNY